ncbi:hypothetical protein [Pareuzebyella sediminis]|uniref:hypothetical protein n=1 Tax=Pareuzebyella sediminis TaxID=2607998 RepID=UPI0011EFD83C|nr:hypothetical protein [Pareuzebyella sediminis]
MKRISLIFMTCIVFLGCKKKDSPNSPEKALLTAPAKNSECTPVQTTTGTSNVVRFSWQVADYTDLYELRVTNLNTGTVQTKSTSSTVETLSLEKGIAFSWVVVSKNSQTTTTATSDSWFFYNPGSQTTYTPFPAEIVAPKSGSTIIKDINNEVTLDWEGTDIDGDIESYEIYFSTENPPETLIATLNANTTEQKVSVASNTVYYWRVITKDAAGNSSDTGTFDFRCH